MRRKMRRGIAALLCAALLAGQTASAAEIAAESGETAENAAGNSETAENAAGSNETAEAAAGNSETAENAAGSGETAEAVSENARTVVISSVEAWNAFAKKCVTDSYSQGLTVLLTCDLDFGGEEFCPAPLFAGVFDGQGHTFSGIRLTGDASVLGVFRQTLSGSEIRNLNVSAHIKAEKNGENMGGIVGVNYGTVSSCTFTGTLEGNRVVGGIAGSNRQGARIESCSVSGSAGSQHRTGGIAGENSGMIADCFNDMDVNTDYEMVKDADSTVLSSVLSLSMSEEERVDIADVGGIAGYSDGVVENCVNRGSVGYPHTGYNVGGIVGRQSGFVTGCQNNGEVTGRKDVGGIVGQMEPVTSWSGSGQNLSGLENLQDQLRSLQSQVSSVLSGLSDTEATLRTDVQNVLGRVNDTIVITGDLTGLGEQWLNDNLETVNEFSSRISRMMSGLAPAGEDIGDFTEGLSEVFSGFSELSSVIREVVDTSKPGFEALDQALSDLESAMNAGQSSIDSIKAAQEHKKNAFGDEEQNADSLKQLGDSFSALSAALKELASALRPEGTAGTAGTGSGTADETGAAGTGSGTADGTGAAGTGLETADETGTAKAGSETADETGTADAALKTEERPNTQSAEEEIDGAAELEISVDAAQADQSVSGLDGAGASQESGGAAGESALPSADTDLITDIEVVPEAGTSGAAGTSGSETGSAAGNSGSETGSVAGISGSEAGGAAGTSGSEASGAAGISGSGNAGGQSTGLAPSASQEQEEALLQDMSDLTERIWEIWQQLGGDMEELSGKFSAVSEALSQLALAFDGLAFQEIDGEQIQLYMEDLQAAFAELETISGSMTSSVSNFRKAVQSFSENGSDSMKTALDQTAKVSTKLSVAMGSLTSAVRTATGVFTSLAQEPALQFTPISEEQSAQTERLFDSLEDIVSAAGDLSDHLLSGRTASGLQGASDQLFTVFDGIISLIYGLDGQEVGDYREDISASDTTRTEGAVTSCKNFAPVEADTNAGGIIGAVSLEISFDLEDDLNLSSVLAGGAKYLIYASVRECENYSDITAGKSAAGGIAGLMDYGAVQNSFSGGTIEAAENYAGGIVGNGKGTVKSCYARVNVSAASYAGGIAGYGYTIQDSCAMPHFMESGRCQGAIAGEADGTVSGNYYTGDTVGGVNGFSFADQCVPVTYEELVTMPDTPELFRNITVTFMVEGEVFDEIETEFGGSIASLPQVPDKDGMFWKWDDFDQEAVYYNMTVEGEYCRPLTSIATEEEIPLYLAEGVFYGEQKLTAAPYEPELSGSGLEERETLLAATLSISDYEDRFTAHVRAEEDGELYLLSADGTLSLTEFDRDGSYLVFEMENGQSFAYLSREDKSFPRAAIIFAAAAAAALLLLIRKLRKNAKEKQKKKAELEKDEEE